MGDVIRGKCLCGGIEFEMRASDQFGPGLEMGECHCTRCRTWTGASGVPFVVVEPEEFKITNGQELLSRFEDEGFSARVFCGRCGSSLYTDSHGATYYVSAGVLKDLKLKPAFHVQVAYKAPWHEIGGDAPQFAEMPGEG
jgi:hypothetical protein